MPRNRPLNKAIGTCPCPFKSCDQVGDVFRYRARSENQAKHRHAGKLYMRCTSHGLTNDQEWLLANATITGEQSEPETPPTIIEPAGSDALDKPGDQAAPAEPAPPAPKAKPADDGGWGFF